MSPYCRAAIWPGHAGGVNPGQGFVRIALVADIEECLEAAQRIADFCQTL